MTAYASAVLKNLERAWRGPLSEASLVAEVGASDGEIRAALRSLGALYSNAWDAEEGRRLLYEQFPACLVLALPGIGALDYAHGNFWTGVWQQAGMSPRQGDQATWGWAFREGLDRFRLARFRGLPQVNVGEIMMHAGIPQYSLADFLQLLLQRLDRDPSTDAGSILAWATAPGHGSRLFTLDKPVQRFLQYGGDYAEDIVDRSLELLDRLREPDFDTDGLGLPAWIVERARVLADDGTLQLTRRRPRTGKAAREKPRLEFDPFGVGVAVSLPPVPLAPNGLAAWTVHLDGVSQTIRSQSPWPGSTETAPATALPLTAPASRALVRLGATGEEWEIDIVDRDDPLLVFAEDGRHFPPNAALPPEPLWLLHPDNADDEIVMEGGHHELDEVAVPYGWGGWRLRRVDLAVGASVQLGAGRRRSVHGARRARLIPPTPLRGVLTIDSRPVFSSRPRVELPADPGTTVAWSIQVRRPGVRAQITSQALSIDGEASIDPWADHPRPLVGSYEVTVRGPLGRGLRRTVEIVEGLGIISAPKWRELGWAGLSPTAVTATKSIASLQLEPPVVHLGPDEPTAQFTASGSEHSEIIRVTPPHMAVRRGGVGDQWSCRPLRLTVETLDADTLSVRMPAAIPAMLVVRSGGTDVQTVPQEFSAGQEVARFNLGRIADTVRLRGSAQLDIVLETARYPVARCEPQRLAHEIILDGDGRLVLSGSMAIDGLSAGCYQVYAPWREPEVLTVRTDLTTPPLPDRLRRGGPLVVLLRIDDPWLPTPWPRWPGHENSFHLAGGAWSAHGPNIGETQLSGSLAGVSDRADADAVPFAGPLYLKADDLKRYVQVDVRKLCADLLGTHPRATLQSVAKGDLVGIDAVAPLVHAGLASLPPKVVVEPDDELRLWTISPLAAVLASAHSLAMSDVLREQVLMTCGPIADALLRGEGDPAARAGSFEGAERFSTMTPEQVDQIWRAAVVVPRGLLSADERAVAARELFDSRSRPGVQRVANDVRRRLPELTELIRRSGHPRALAAVKARGGTAGWVALPSLSIALALSARLAARDARLSQLVMDYVPLHASLARHAPRLVTVDVVLAELLLTGVDR